MVEVCAARLGSVGGACVAALVGSAGGGALWLVAAPLLQLVLAALLGPQLGSQLGSQLAVQSGGALLGRAARAPRSGGRPRAGGRALKAAALGAASAPALFCLLVLFGAPALAEHEATFSLAALLAVLTVLPVALYAGADRALAVLTGADWFTGDRILEMLQQNVLLTLFGAWCGGIVIPLDWDRPWQVWPIPCYRGALLGYIFSNLITHIKLIPAVSKQLSKKPKLGFFM